MKIAQVCPYDFSRPGGVKNHIESLTRYLTLAGHEVVIIAPFPTVNQSKVYHFGSNRSLHVGGTKIDINIALGNDRKALKNFLTTQQFDIIHFHTFWNPILPWQIRRFSKSKHITTFHDTPKNQFVGKNIMPFAAKLVFRLMDGIISVSETQASYINRFSDRAIEIIPNGIDLDYYLKPVIPIDKYKDGKFNLLFLGRLEERKGLIYALKSYLDLKRDNDNLRLIIAGDGEERTLAEAFISKHHLEDVEMLGFVSEEDKLRLLHTADLYIAPALFGESFGIVLLEAMAMGTPIAGFSNQGYLNVLSAEQQQYFAEPGNLEGLTNCIKNLIVSEESMKHLSKHGLEVVKQYDWKIHVQKIEELYRSLI
ncbi:glycosyltransferase family 4 protein [Reichenbachiella ulvae]|uniref:Glycosyltransferase family 4 protein n=1 Tax=Reichenbachiella ulvae TaxID=2980104 RepID=A0ABT3CUK8_9BACT|nr:glycosyltransferase family 4 protein [Reichenbachiella ulvae]MCV9387244.1 glycosyltransferase family 4 protein [Reichenbachiella ulvae]